MTQACEVHPTGRLMVKDIKHGQAFHDLLVVRRFSLMPYRDAAKGHYLTATLEDRSGKVEARAWDKGEQFAQILKEETVFRIRGQATEYQGAIQLHIHGVEPVDAREVDWGHFLPVTPLDRDQLEADLDRAIAAIANPHLKMLLARLFAEGDIRRAYVNAPAAMTHHQAYIGGLLEHSLRVHATALGLAANVPEADRDLLAAGAILHDIGKIEELQYQSVIGYTVAGNLLGHIVIGINLLDREIAGLPGFPEELRLRLLHLIASHHGEYEWQSPKRPQTAEAMILHYADRFDADMFKVRQALGEAKDGWSPYLKGMERRFYAGVADSGALQGNVAQASPAQSASQPSPHDRGGGERS
ncbi:HD domain-containing protein [Heliobacterium gestii]|uniref:HD domain-containing protein n=1 Tax=Heliomicrobium gestii TaxID=2699 RepID=A0A845LHV4_HELGE|nr:HD domain-containing protein [Heliomicrobium gestii]MBM7867611.1 3'-5' exoribonuclease [Heliomicrobium gestii]MZP44005.1 HD domain-containing protein [Heliomicrobium gestii]